MNSETTILLLVGPTQVGKSSFVKALAPPGIAKSVLVGNGGGVSKTSEVTIYQFINTYLGSLTLIDIPGPDENRRLYKKQG